MTDGHLFNNISLGGHGGIDSDFVDGKDDDSGSPTDDSGDDDSVGSPGGDEKPVKKDTQKASSSSKLVPKRKSKDGDEDGSKKKKKKKKKKKMIKDLNAPKRALTGYLFYSRMERENVRKANPGISMTGVAKILGEQGKKMTAEEKEPFEAEAQADKKRYKEEVSGYKSNAPVNIDSGNESDSS